MKRIYTIIVAVLITASVFAQAPQKMTYQAVVRDANNNLVTNTQVGIEINILEGSTTGTQIYTETQTPTTNDNGLLTIEFGGQTGFDAIDWSNGIYFLETKIDPDNSGTYTIVGVSQLLTVPYALHAKTAENISGTINENDPVYTNSQASNITSTDITNLSNLSGVNTGDQDISGIATNEQAIQDTASQIRADISGFITNENDPIYTNSQASNITSTDITNLSNLSGVNTGDQDISGIATNEQAIQDTASQIRADISDFITNEADPIYTNSQASNITSTDITNLSNLSGVNTGDQDISGIAINEQAIQDTASQIRADIPDVSSFITTETDPVYTASPANGITNTDINNWNNKLDTEVDGSVTNEVNTNLELNGTILEITDANGTLTADLSSLQSGSGENGTFSISYLRQKHTILVGDNYFDPQVLTVNKGDTIEFIWVEGYHTTTTDVTTGLDHWDVPITSTNTSYTEVIDGSDTIAYYCQAQGGAGGVGMSGTIIIRNPNDSINGNNIQTANMDNDPENEIQNLSINGSVIYLENGGNVNLPLNVNSPLIINNDTILKPRYVFDTNANWLCPEGISQIIVELWGAGGGGGGGASSGHNSNTASANGGNGGKGGHNSGVINVISGQSYSITIGVGGIGGVKGSVSDYSLACGTDGADGGSSSFNGILLAEGGSKGTHGCARASNSYSQDGANGSNGIVQNYPVFSFNVVNRSYIPDDFYPNIPDAQANGGSGGSGGWSFGTAGEDGLCIIYYIK